MVEPKRNQTMMENDQKMRYLFILTLSSLFVGVYNQLDKSNYGPYEIIYSDISVCKGSKRSDCTQIQFGDISNPSDIKVFINITKDCPITMGRIVISAHQKDKSWKKLFNYQINKPCDHFVLGPLLAETVNVTSPCKVFKGYVENHVNVLEKSRMFLSQNFFYGTYLFKVLMYNKVDNILCTIITVDIVKK